MTTTVDHQQLNIPMKGTNQTDNDILVKGGFLNTKNHSHVHETTTKKAKKKEKNTSSMKKKKKKNSASTKESTIESCPCKMVSLLHIGSKKPKSDASWYAKYSDSITRKQTSAMAEQQQQDDVFSISYTATTKTISLHSSGSTCLHRSIDKTEPRLRLRNYYNVRETKEALYNEGSNENNKEKTTPTRQEVQHEQRKELKNHPLLKKEDPILSAEVSRIVGAPLSELSAPSSTHDNVLQSTAMLLSSETLASSPTTAASLPSPPPSSQQDQPKLVSSPTTAAPSPPPSQQDQPELAPLFFQGAFVATWDNVLYSLDKEETSPLSRSGRTRRSREILEVERRLRNTSTSQFIEISLGIQQADKISSTSSAVTTEILRVEDNLHPISTGDDGNNYMLEEASVRSLQSNHSSTLEGYVDNQ